jgi:single-stranded DNA-specific DHH superfamily exonuclease
LEIIEQIIEEQNLLENKIIAVRLNEAQKTTLSGLIANELMHDYGKPVLILSATKHPILNEKGEVVKVELWWEGSFRGPNIPGLEDAKTFFAETGLTEYTAGHANAGGLGVKDIHFEAFVKACNSALSDFDFTPNYKVDFIMKAQDLVKYKADFYSIMEYKHLWGQEVEQPKFIIENINVTKDNLLLMKGTTLKIIPSVDADIDLIKFKVSEQEYENLYSEAGCVTITVLGVCEKNTWNGKPQIIIKDYVITDKCDYYF